MASRTRLRALVTALDWEGAADALAESPELIGLRDSRGLGWLHLTGAVDITGRPDGGADSVAMAGMLADLGLDIDGAAFSEGGWQATPLWFAIDRGRNLALAEWLLLRGADPNYCLLAAARHNDLKAMKLVISHGADVDDPSAGGSPFLKAIGAGHFEAAEELLRHGADVNRATGDGSTALHLMLKKGSALRHLAMLARFDARGDIPDAGGLTAAAILRRKRDPELRRLADQLARG